MEARPASKAMVFQIPDTAFVEAQRTKPADVPEPVDAPLALERPAGQSRFQAAMALVDALDTVERWQDSGDYLADEDVAQAQATVATSLLEAFPVLGMQRRLAERPGGEHTAIQIALQGTKILNDSAGQPEVDAVFTPGVKGILERAVEQLETRFPGLSIEFASEDHKGALVVCGCDLESAVRWQTELHRIVIPQLALHVERFLDRAAQQNPRAAEKILAAKRELLEHPGALMHIGVQPIPPNADGPALIRAMSHAETSARLARDDASAGRTDLRGVFTPEKIQGALAAAQGVTQRLSLRPGQKESEAPAIVLDGVSQPVMLSTQQDSGEPVTRLNERLVRALRKNALSAHGKDDPNAPLINDLRRALQLSGLVDFVYYGTAEDIAVVLPKQLEWANPIFERLLAGSSVNIDNLRDLLRQSPSAESVCHAGRPSAMPFYQRLCSQRDHGIISFDLKGLGPEILNWQFDEIRRLAASGEPITQERLFQAKTDVNDRVQAEKARFTALVNRALILTYEMGAMAKLQRGDPPESLEALKSAVPSNRLLHRDAVLAGGDELTVLVPPEVVEDPLLVAVLLKNLDSLNAEKPVRCTFTSIHAADDSRETIQASYEAAERELDRGNQTLKRIEAAWSALLGQIPGRSFLVPGAAPGTENLSAQPYVYDARTGQMAGYSPDLASPSDFLARLEHYGTQFLGDLADEP